MSDFGKILMGLGVVAGLMTFAYNISIDQVAQDVGWLVITIAICAFGYGLWRLVRG